MLTGTANFSLAEVAANTEWPIPFQFQDNAQATLDALQLLRDTLGVGRLRLTSLWRSTSGNAALPGSVPNSRHLSAQAVDFVPLDILPNSFARAFSSGQAAGVVPLFDQLLIESDHIHYDPGGVYGYRQEALVNDAVNGWTSLGDWIAAHPAASAVAALAPFPARAVAAPATGAGS